jgi:CelD/BcsL family acetyltransferase involved in cellulose biosynthesis
VISADLRPVAELNESEIASWRELADSAVDPNPFFDPDFVLPAAQELRPGDLGILVVTEGGDWVCSLPVTRTRGWRRIPLTGLVAWNHLYCFLGTPLLRAGASDDAVARLLQEGGEHGGSFLGLDLLGTDGPFGASLERAQAELHSHPVELTSFERATLERRPEQTYMALSAKHRRNFERLRRRLADELGAELELRDRSDDPAAWQEFLAVEASGWKGGEGTGTALATIGHGELFLEICRRLSPRGMLQLISAEAGGRTVAMLCSLISSGTAFTFKIASAADLLQYSPGVQVEILYLDRFHADSRLECADSCAVPGNAMINRLWPDRRRIEVRAIPRRDAQGGMAKPILQGAAWVGRKVRA